MDIRFAHGCAQVGDVVRKTSAYVLKEGKSGEYAKRGHGARPFEDYVPIQFPCDEEVSVPPGVHLGCTLPSSRAMRGPFGFHQIRVTRFQHLYAACPAQSIRYARLLAACRTSKRSWQPLRPTMR